MPKFTHFGLRGRDTVLYSHHTDDHNLDTHSREKQISQISHTCTYPAGRVMVSYRAHNIS
jgi:hypothetical protein